MVPSVRNKLWTCRARRGSHWRVCLLSPLLPTGGGSHWRVCLLSPLMPTGGGSHWRVCLLAPLLPTASFKICLFVHFTSTSTSTKFSRKKERRWFWETTGWRPPTSLENQTGSLLVLSWCNAIHLMCVLQYLGKYLNLQTIPFSEMYNVPMAQNVK